MLEIVAIGTATPSSTQAATKEPIKGSACGCACRIAPPDGSWGCVCCPRQAPHFLCCENGTSLKTGFMAQEALSWVSSAFQNINRLFLSVEWQRPTFKLPPVLPLGTVLRAGFTVLPELKQHVMPDEWHWIQLLEYTWAEQVLTVR